MGKSQSKISKEDMDFLQQKTDLDKSTIEVSLKKERDMDSDMVNTDIDMTVDSGKYTYVEKQKRLTSTSPQ